MPTIPVVIDSSTFQPARLDTNTPMGPAFDVVGGPLYILVQDLTTDAPLVYKSTDGGATWSFLAATPGGVVAGSGCVSIDQKILWITTDTGGGGDDGILTSFHAATETFGPQFDLPDPAMHGCSINQSANGNLHLANGCHEGDEFILYSVFNGAAFTGPTVLLDLFSLPGAIQLATAPIIFPDLNDHVHILSEVSNLEIITPDQLLHWVASNAGAIILNQQLVGDIGSPFLPGLGCQSGANLIVPAVFGNSPPSAGYLTASGNLDNPTWVYTNLAQAINFGTQFPGQAHATGAGGGDAVFIYPVDFQIFSIVFTGGSGGAPSLIYDSEVTPPPAPLLTSTINALSISPLNPNAVAIGFNGNRTVGFVIPGFFLPFGTPSPPVTPAAPPFIGGGGSSTFGGPSAPFGPAAIYNKANIWVSCLCRKYSDWNCIDWSALSCSTPPDYTILGFGADLDDEMFDSVAPYQYGAQVSGTRFYKSNVIPCPAAISGDVLVLDFTVPVGFDSVITGLVNGYLGSGFAEGSGDLIFRLKLNRRWAKDFGQIETSLGTPKTPYPTQILAGSLTRIQYYVNAPNTSGSLNPGVDRVIAQCLGWWYPMDEMARFQKMRRAA